MTANNRPSAQVVQARTGLPFAVWQYGRTDTVAGGTDGSIYPAIDIIFVVEEAEYWEQRYVSDSDVRAMAYVGLDRVTRCWPIYVDLIDCQSKRELLTTGYEVIGLSVITD